MDSLEMCLLRAGLSLEERPDGLTLTDGTLSLRADFEKMLPRLKTSNLQRELLVKAARVKGAEHPVVLDATAGFAEDSMLLAAAGFSVVLFENDPVIAPLLSDALCRAREMPELKEAVERMTLIQGDSIEAMHEMKNSPGGGSRAEVMHSLKKASPEEDGGNTLLRQGQDIKKNRSDGEAANTKHRFDGDQDRVFAQLKNHPADVIFLDPMFPEREKSALVKKKFQLLQKLERPCADEEGLLEAALGLSPKKVVVKRPLKGPYLAGRKPSYSLKGKAIRYDCYVM